MISRRVMANVIFFFVGSGVLIVLMATLLFRIEPTYRIFAIFPETGGVVGNHEVTYRGVTVGQIGDIEVIREPVEGVRVELVIDSEHDEIPSEGTRARVMFKSAVGEQFVDILPQQQDGPYFSDGDTIPIERTELPVQQEELLRLLGSVLDGVPPDAIERLVDTLGTGLGGRGEELHLGLGALDPITEVLARRTELLNRLNVNGDRLGTAFDATRSDFATGIQRLATVSETLADSSDELEDLLSEGAEELGAVRSLLAARKGQLSNTVGNLATLTRDTHENLDSLRDLLDRLPPFLEMFLVVFDEDTDRLRFGQVVDQPAPEACLYDTPQRSPTETGDAPYHPIITFECQGGSGSGASILTDATR